MEDKFDRFIDEALADYTRVPVPSGLEARVVRNVQRSRTRRKSFVGVGALSALAASVLLVVAPEEPERIKTQPRSSSLIVPVPVYVAPLDLRAGRLHRGARHLMVKQNVFPGPSALTSEERALIALVKRDPSEASRLFKEMSNPADEPLRIEPIRIVPPGEDR